MKTRGRNLVVALDGAAVGAAKTCTVDVKMGFVEVVDPTAGGWKGFVPQAGEWSVSCGGFVSEFTETLYSALYNRTAVAMRCVDSDQGVTLGGTAWVESLQLTGSVREMATFSLKLRGSGALKVIDN